MSLEFSLRLKEFLCACLVINLSSVAYSEAKTFSRCELADALRARRLNDTANWVCLVESESGRRTNAISGLSHEFLDYGLFQISGLIWCNQGDKGCGLPCSKLIDDNIDDDVACAKTIYRAQGFGAWYGWKAKCRGSLAAYRCSSDPGPGSNTTDPCFSKGGYCKNKTECSNPVEKIDGQWSCPHDPADVWCCLGGHPLSTGSTTPCVRKGGACRNKTDCSNPQEKIDGAWSCPDDPDDIWCCLNNGGGSGNSSVGGGGSSLSSPCTQNGGRCIYRFECSGTNLEKINGTWSCPENPDDVWCCM